MSFFRISKQSFLILAFLLSALLVHAQKSTQKQLEEKKADIKKELKEINALLFTNKQKQQFLVMLKTLVTRLKENKN